MNKKYWKYLILFLLTSFHLLMLIKFKFTAWPEMLAWPYLITKEILPYSGIAVAHTPLLIFKLAIFYKFFGTGIFQLEVFTWILIIFNDLMLFWLVNKLWNINKALVAVGFYFFLQLFFDGNGLWFESLLIPLALLAYYLIKVKKYLFAGLVWAIMILTKQTAVWFLIPIAVSLVEVGGKRIRIKENLVGFVFGPIIVFLLFILLLFTFNLLPDFYNWAIRYGIFILPKAAGQIKLPDLKNLILTAGIFSAFIPYLYTTRFKKYDLLLWSMAGGLGAYPRFEYFHIQPALPFLAIAATQVFTKNFFKNRLNIIFLILYSICFLYIFIGFYIRNFNEGIRFYEQDVIDVSNYIKNKVNPEEKIFVMNWWDNIYALTNTIPATYPLVPQLEWYQDMPGIQEKEIADLEYSHPNFIILSPYSESGLSSYIPEKLYDYVQSSYSLKEKIDGIYILELNK